MKTTMEIYNDVCELVKNTPFKEGFKLLDLDDEKWYSEEELKEILDNWNCHNEETTKTINSIKLRLRLE